MYSQNDYDNYIARQEEAYNTQCEPSSSKDEDGFELTDQVLQHPQLTFYTLAQDKYTNFDIYVLDTLQYTCESRHHIWTLYTRKIRMK